MIRFVLFDTAKMERLEFYWRTKPEDAELENRIYKKQKRSVRWIPETNLK